MTEISGSDKFRHWGPGLLALISIYAVPAILGAVGGSIAGSSIEDAYETLVGADQLNGELSGVLGIIGLAGGLWVGYTGQRYLDAR